MVKTSAKADWKIYLTLLLAVTAIFFCLYYGCIFGDRMYAYSDIGADTVEQYLPVMIYETRAVRDGNSTGYDLSYGLGDDHGSSLLKYLNPVELPILLLGENHLAAGLMISAYLKYCVISVFAMLFFLRLLKDEIISFICSLLWTYSGYAVLWGQHYRFLTVILAFTGAMYGIQLFLEGDKKRYLLIPLLALLAGTSYYFLYTSCFFFGIYGVAYLLFTGKGWKHILNKMIWLMLSMIPAVCIAGIYFIPAMTEFFSSARVEEVGSAAGSTSVFYVFDYILCLLGRLLSVNILGIGNNYHGPTNYYEMAILSVSLMSLFSLTLLMTGKYCLRVLVLTALGGVLLCMPGFSRIIVFSETNQRWTYLLCFAQVILIGFGLKELCSGGSVGVIRRIISVLAVFTVIFYTMDEMWYRFLQYGVSMDITAFTIVFVFAVEYSILVVAGKWMKTPWVIAAFLVTAELILCGYGTVNTRELVSRDAWYGEMYYDGTENVVDWLKNQDPSLYRVNKTYDSVRQNDAMVQGYNGLGVYLSTNSEELVDLYQSYGYPLMQGNRTNWVRFAGDDLLSNVMLGVKYIITPEQQELDGKYYEKIWTMDGFSVYQNRYFTGFGYLYTGDSQTDGMNTGTRLEKLLQLSESYYLTRETDDPGDRISEDILTLDLSPLPAGPDGKVHFTLPELPEGWLLSGMKVRITASQPADLRLYRPDGKLVDQVYYGAGETLCCLDAAALEEGFWLEGGAVESAQLVLVNQQRLLINLESLQESGMTDLRQRGNQFKGKITNSGTRSAMLCVPLVYSRHWRAWVDGEETEVFDINGGLVGISIPAGDHRVKLCYQNQSFAWGGWISAIGITLYILGSYVWLKQEKNGRFQIKRNMLELHRKPRK